MSEYQSKQELQVASVEQYEERRKRLDPYLERELEELKERVKTDPGFLETMIY